MTTETLTVDRIARHAPVFSPPSSDVLAIIIQRASDLIAQEIAEHGYQTDGPVTSSVRDAHTGLLTTNTFVVMVEQKVLLTRSQWLERHIPIMERYLAGAEKKQAECPCEDHAEDVEHYSRVLGSYRAELESL